MIYPNGFFTLNTNDEGIVEIVGTNTKVTAQEIAKAPSGKCYVSGTLLNLTPQDFYLTVKLLNAEEAQFKVPAYAGIVFNKQPMQSLYVSVNGTIRLQALGFIVDPEVGDVQGSSSLNSIAGVFLEPDKGRIKIYDKDSHKDINTATTTTLIDPTSGKTYRLYKVTISSQGAVNGVVLKHTNSASDDDAIIGTLNFGGIGTFVYDFGDEGLANPKGVNGLLELVSPDTTVLDVDVIYRED